MTLFDKYGGVPTVTVIVRDFYKRMFKRPNLRRYFEGVDMENLILHQVKFIAYVMGKPAEDYPGRILMHAHKDHGITAASFELTVELLRDSLIDGGVTTDDVDTIISKAREVRGEIVSR